MSQANMEAVRQPITVKAHPRRRLEQRLWFRFPRMAAFLVRAGWRLFALLSPRSQLRQAIVRRYVQQGFEATNRRDLEAAFALYHPHVESIFPAQFVALGFEPVYRGREARIDAQRRWLAEWGELWFELEELIDLGDRVLVVSRMKGSGLSSGAGTEMDCVFIYTVAGGRAIRERFFFDRREAFEAAGLGE
jgi:ketosteroid isomerase-like protein